MHAITCSVAMSPTATAILYAQTHQPAQAARGTIQFRVLDAFTGERLLATLTLRSASDGADLSQYVSGLSALGLPYGTYIAEIRVRGFDRVRREVTVQAPFIQKTIGMRLGSPVEGAAPSGFAGTVTSGGQPAPDVSLKLVSAYSDLLFETVSGEHGQFSFHNVDLGAYILIAATHGSVTTRLVYVRGNEEGQTIELLDTRDSILTPPKQDLRRAN